MGISGIHRLLGERERLAEASVVVVVAGMEGALPSVVGGFVDVPVVGVPTIQMPPRCVESEARAQI